MKPNPFASLNHFTVPLATIRLLENQGATAPRSTPPERDGYARTLCPAPGSRAAYLASQKKTTRNVPGGISAANSHIHSNPRRGEYRRVCPGMQATILWNGQLIAAHRVPGSI